MPTKQNSMTIISSMLQQGNLSLCPFLSFLIRSSKQHFPLCFRMKIIMKVPRLLQCSTPVYNLIGSANLHQQFWLIFPALDKEWGQGSGDFWNFPIWLVGHQQFWQIIQVSQYYLWTDRGLHGGLTYQLVFCHLKTFPFYFTALHRSLKYYCNSWKEKATNTLSTKDKLPALVRNF